MTRPAASCATSLPLTHVCNPVRSPINRIRLSPSFQQGTTVTVMTIGGGVGLQSGTLILPLLTTVPLDFRTDHVRNPGSTITRPTASCGINCPLTQVWSPVKLPMNRMRLLSSFQQGTTVAVIATGVAVGVGFGLLHSRRSKKFFSSISSGVNAQPRSHCESSRLRKSSWVLKLKRFCSFFHRSP
jgi:hypothetical protein